MTPEDAREILHEAARLRMPRFIGRENGNGENVRVGMVLSAVWFAVAAVPVLVRVRGIVRPIRLWMSREGRVGADKPAVVAVESFSDAREAVLAAQPPTAAD